MSYAVLIRNNTTGAVRTYTMDGCDWDREGSEFLWTEGNYGCDCNRSLFFARAADEDDPDDHVCGTEHFAVIKAILPDGTEIKIDDDAS